MNSLPRFTLDSYGLEPDPFCFWFVGCFAWCCVWFWGLGLVLLALVRLISRTSHLRGK